MARSKKKGIMLSKRVINSLKVDIGNNIGNKANNELIFKNKPIIITVNFNDIHDINTFFIENIKTECEVVCNNNMYKNQNYIKKNNHLVTIDIKKKIDNNK